MNTWPHLGLELAAYTALVMKPLAYPEEEKTYNAVFSINIQH